jgi:hypothetical protein
MAGRSRVDPGFIPLAAGKSKQRLKKKSAMKNGRLWVKMHLWAKKLAGPLRIGKTVF